MVKKIKAHNSLYGGERRTDTGRSVKSRTTYSSTDCFNADKRTAEEFVLVKYTNTSPKWTVRDL